MLDLKAIRADAAPFVEALKKRGGTPEPIENIVELDKKWRALNKETDALKADRNNYSKKINEKKKAGENVEETIIKTKRITERIKELGSKCEFLEEGMTEILLTMPNCVDKSVPEGAGEEENVEVGRWGEPKAGGGDVLPHYEIGVKLGLLDFERGVKLAGARFSVMRGEMARMARALEYYMLEKAVENKYFEVRVPYIVNTAAMRGTGQLPKFGAELYKLEESDFWLIPTTEVPLVNLHAGEIFEEKDLPIKYCSHSQNFRKEAGNYQKDIKGIIRQHQFSKVELVKFCTPENSFDELEALVKNAQSVLEGLKLPYRTMELCTGDIGFAAAKTYDLEVWIPSQDKYREISSCSNCTDFQARRANIKFRREGKNEFVHTLNGTGVAVERTLVAIMENYQEDGKILVPEALQKFMGCEVIGE